MGLHLGDLHLFELEKLDKLCDTARHESMIIRFSLNVDIHSPINNNTNKKNASKHVTKINEFTN